MRQRSDPVVRPNRLDFLQAFSGALLACFVCIHLLLESSVIISPSLSNGIAWLLEATYLVHIAAPVILLLVVFHFYIAARKMPFRAGELRLFTEHARGLRHIDTWLWLVQVATAIIILVFIMAHIYVVMTSLPVEISKTAGRLHSGWLSFYLVLAPAAIVHTGIGIYRIGAKYGWCIRANRLLWRRVLLAGMGGYIVLSLLALTRTWFLI